MEAVAKKPRVKVSPHESEACCDLRTLPTFFPLEARTGCFTLLFPDNRAYSDRVRQINRSAFERLEQGPEKCAQPSAGDVVPDMVSDRCIPLPGKKLYLSNARRHFLSTPIHWFAVSEQTTSRIVTELARPRWQLTSQCPGSQFFHCLLSSCSKVITFQVREPRRVVNFPSQR